MTLKEHFQRLKTVVEKNPRINRLIEGYSDSDAVIYLHLLAFLVIQRRKRNRNKFPSALHRYIQKSYELKGLVSPEILDIVRKKNELNIADFESHQFKEACGDLITSSLKIAESFKTDFELLTSRNALIKNLGKQPKGIRRFRGAYNTGKTEFSRHLRNRSDNRIIISIGGDACFEIDPFALGDTGLIDLGLIWMLEALRMENNFRLQPELDEAVAKLAAPLPGQHILNLFCGDGSILVKLQELFPDHGLRFSGIVNNPFTHLLCEANCLANGVTADIHFYDPLAHSSINEQVKRISSAKGADIGICVLPNRSIANGDELGRIVFEDGRRSGGMESAFIKLTRLGLKAGGRALVAVNDGFLMSRKNRPDRKEYLETDQLEQVVSLSPEVFRPHPFKASVLVFDKNKTLKNTVVFDGEGPDLKRNPVPSERILKDRKLGLSAGQYASKTYQELESILSESKYDIYSIRDLVVPPVSGINHFSENGPGADGLTSMKFVQVRNLNSNDQDPTLRVQALHDKKLAERASDIIDFSTILVSRIGFELRPTYFEFRGEPIAIGPHVISLRLKDQFDREKISYEYFQFQLQTRLVRIQANSMRSGSAIVRLANEDLLDIQIILPPLEEQRRQIFEMQGELKKRAIDQARITEVEMQRDAIEDETIANFNHSLKNKLSVLRSDFTTLVGYIQRKERENSPVSVNDLARTPARMEDVSQVETIQIVANRIETYLSDSSMVFDNSRELQGLILKKEAVDLVSYFLKEIRPSVAEEGFKLIIVVPPGLKLNVLLDRDKFKILIENLIQNSRIHGFTGESPHNKIVMELSKADGDDAANTKILNENVGNPVYGYARIVYRDNGKGFPEGFSFGRYTQRGERAGKTPGTGIGGSWIDKTIKLHDGLFKQLQNDKNSEFKVQLEILLPLEE
jgi:type I restriction enzyme M protein